MAMTPGDFEEHVAFVVRQLDCFQEADFKRNVRVQGVRQPGEYEIDISVRIMLSGVIDFFLIVECKNWTRPVDRPVVQKLAQTRDAVSAHKAAIASNSGFTKEAVAVAKALGIALWVVAETTSSIISIMGFQGPSLERYQRLHQKIDRLRRMGYRFPEQTGWFSLRTSDDAENSQTYLHNLDPKLAELSEARPSKCTHDSIKLYSITRVDGSATVGDSLVPGLDHQLAVTNLAQDLERHLNDRADT